MTRSNMAQIPMLNFQKESLDSPVESVTMAKIAHRNISNISIEDIFNVTFVRLLYLLAIFPALKRVIAATNCMNVSIHSVKSAEVFSVGGAERQGISIMKTANKEKAAPAYGNRCQPFEKVKIPDKHPITPAKPVKPE